MMNTFQILTSFKNPKIQFVRDLIKDRAAREENGLFIVEGVRLAEEASRLGILPRSVFFCSHLSGRGLELIRQYQGAAVDVTEVKPDILDKLSDTETSQGILLVLPQLVMPMPASTDLVLILDQVRDPGNMGTILRSAAAAGAGVVFVAPGSVDPFMPKVVRAGMGAHFHFPILQADWTRISECCKVKTTPPLQVVLAEAGAGLSMWQADLTQPLALVIGGEADGPGPHARQLADTLVHIPMPGNFESLNAGVAASLLLYEIIRQRNS